MNISLGFCFPILTSMALEIIFWVLCKGVLLTQRFCPEVCVVDYNLSNSEERVMGANTNYVEIYDSWVGQKAAVDEASCTCFFCAAWSHMDGHTRSVKFYQHSLKSIWSWQCRTRISSSSLMFFLLMPESMRKYSSSKEYFAYQLPASSKISKDSIYSH